MNENFKITIEHNGDVYSVELDRSDVNLTEVHEAIKTVLLASGFLKSQVKEILNSSSNEKATNKQVGGNHYKMAIQPVEFIEKNNIGFCEGNAIKYICRHQNKNGVEDINKAIHYLELIKQLKYG